MAFTPHILLAGFATLTRPLLHGSTGVWDEIIFGIAFAISVIIFITLAFADRKQNTKKEKQKNEQDS